MTSIIETEGLGKRYGRTTALTGCTLRVPAGRVVGLVGPNGAGKSTLLGLTCGLITPTAGTITVLGGRPAGGAEQLARVGFVAQDAPVYSGLSVADHLRLGARLNPRWDASLAKRRIQRLGLDPAQRAGRLSGGQRAQLALTVAAAKRAELLILDEPVAALDPLARGAFLRDLLDFVAEPVVRVRAAASTTRPARAQPAAIATAAASSAIRSPAMPVTFWISSTDSAASRPAATTMAARGADRRLAVPTSTPRATSRIAAQRSSATHR
jgi:ABC-type Mn2+/Zn2+ transport system ATPase subunit